MRGGAFARVAIMAVAGILGLVSSASAHLISYTIPGSAFAYFDTSSLSNQAGFGTLSIGITSLQINPTSVSQNISDLAFTLSSPQLSSLQGSNVVLSSSSGNERGVSATGVPFNAGPKATGWLLQTGVDDGLGIGMRLCVLCSATAPTHTIIGELSGTAVYPVGDGSIRGTANSPYLSNTVLFTILVKGLTDDVYVDSAFFSFGIVEGTSAQAHCTGQDVSCLSERQLLQVRVPEPSSLLLLGAGLLGLAGFSLRKRLNTK